MSDQHNTNNPVAQGEAPIRCVCASALARARQTYGHLEGCDVWIRRDDSGTAYRGILHVATALPGHLWIERQYGDGRDLMVHVDDVRECTLA
ncbi:hypothetical protein HNR12_002196 [Streptomonospora nanhaiensis]|uniref:Uncharacterized protein n=1 Tax=Streptomonospora nanhaiensis TaxID=1323731 RepID=A0A853BKA2_9ACTN|nr:hypothetical protein [Streptomonospora nanhaiensis]NYI95919.1 hypothetical protein [Streptomonospora nanhaiensis]